MFLQIQPIWFKRVCKQFAIIWNQHRSLSKNAKNYLANGRTRTNQDIWDTNTLRGSSDKAAREPDFRDEVTHTIDYRWKSIKHL